MKISIIGIIAGLILAIIGGDSILKGNWSPSELPVEFILITAFGVFLFLFSLSSIRNILPR